MADPPGAPPPDRSPWAAVPADLAERMRPRISGAVELVIAAVREEVPEYDQPLEGAFGRLISQGVTAGLDQFVGLLGKDGEGPDESVYEALGRAEYRAGRTLDALQSAYRVGARVSWREVAAYAEEEGMDVATLGRLAEAIFAYIDRLSAASVRGYSQEQSLRAGSLQTRRQALVELLVSGPVTDPAAVEEAALAADWPLPSSVAVLAVGDADPGVIARRMPSGSIAAALRPVAVLLVPDAGAPGRRAQIRRALRDRRGVLGPGGPWEEAHVSFARAVAAWPLHAAGELGSDKLAYARDHLLPLLLAADRELTADLVALRLGPLDGMTEAAYARAVATLTAWLDAHGDVAAAAAALHVHPQTVRYRLGGLQERFGSVLEDPARRLELQLALRARDLAG
ncbi:helix-turn-helix domain-containing protein [Paraconexibacter antarcticus]|uniref:Helix-turn-helix domain-containing protein n=1 Tax=Paraconexibacter antarcticus TaxID=2949664 RepID=A0ABY5DSX2_9ACTN|nr:helix-turn-helix domain-containing protein [Paraconexibacter antarcticus]UTI64066.1 helix-turn-helix domain-containing protein [Paraconexibacter antarcticus]